MRSSILLLLTVGVIYAPPIPTFAEQARAHDDFAGRYLAGSPSYRQTVTIQKQSDGTYKAEFLVGTEGCSGSFNGVGRIQSATLVVKSPPPVDPDDNCVVSIVRKGARLQVTEDSCTWHGASCEFAGTYRKR